MTSTMSKDPWPAKHTCGHESRLTGHWRPGGFERDKDEEQLNDSGPLWAAPAATGAAGAPLTLGSGSPEPRPPAAVPAALRVNDGLAADPSGIRAAG